jgi:predicted nucleic acid-binding protein
MADVVVLDTGIDSRLGEPEIVAWVQGWLTRGNLLAVTAPTVFERRFGYESRFQDWVGLWDTYMELLAVRTVEVLSFDLESAVIAGHLRAVCPFPPAARRKRGKSRSARRASWILDILIAATAARHGHPLFTANARDFSSLAARMPEPYRLELVVYPSLP